MKACRLNLTAGVLAWMLLGCGDSGSGDAKVDSVDQAAVVCNPSGAQLVCTLGAGSLVAITSLSAGDADCPHGGTMIETGLDADDDGTLDAGEVNETQFACNGADGADGLPSLIALSALSVGDSNCPTGGSQLDSGLDLDADGSLDEAEITTTSYVCNGEEGLAGADGADGADGATGADGADGADGLTALSASTPEPAGANCASGGIRLDSGLDTSADGTLDGGEITATNYVCNGTDGAGGEGGASSLLTLVDEPAGSNCEAGGVRVQPYLDADGDGALDAGEETGTPNYVCDGDPIAANGTTPIVKTYRSLNVTGLFAGEGSSGTVTAMSASITVPRAGTILAMATSAVYCDSSGFGYDCAPSGTFAFMSLVQSGVGGQEANSGQFVSLVVQPGVDNQISTMNTFEVAAGTHTFLTRGKAESLVMAEDAEMYFGTSEMTLVFIPN